MFRLSSFRTNIYTFAISYKFLSPIHNYKDNDKDIVLTIVLNIKEEQSSHHNYNDKGTEKRYHWNNFRLKKQNDFFPADERYKHWQPIRIHPAVTSSRI